MNPLTQLSLAELRRRTSVKWRQYADDVLPLWVAEMDVPLAAPVAEALHDAVGRGDTGYACGTHYAEALGDFAARRWGWSDLPVDRTTLVPDVMLGIVEVLRLLTGPGDAVVVCAPVYPPFYAFVSHADRRVIEAPLGADQRMDTSTLEEAFRRARADGRRAVFLLCNPHNPTGVVHRRDELEAVADLAGRYGVRVVSDEIHAPLVLPGARFTPYLTVAGAEDALAVLSASKAWNLAGLKSALVVAGPQAVATCGGSRRRSATGRVIWASSRTPPRSATAVNGWTGCWSDSTTTASCWECCWRGTPRPSGTTVPRAPTSPGWTAPHSASTVVRSATSRGW